MCYYSSIKSNPRDIAKAFNVTFPNSELFKPAYSVSAFTFPSLPVISNETPNMISMFQWGLIPFWAKSLELAHSIRQQTLNARSETIFDKPAFRNSIRSKRCLVVVDGFYEWRHVENKAYPYYINLTDRILFALAGIWDGWTNPETKETLNTFAVITTDANELIAKVHNSKKRMPLILPKDKEPDWLDPKSDEKVLKDIMQPYGSSYMKVYPVANKLHNLGYNTTDMTVTELFNYPGLPALV